MKYGNSLCLSSICSVFTLSREQPRIKTSDRGRGQIQERIGNACYTFTMRTTSRPGSLREGVSVVSRRGYHSLKTATSGCQKSIVFLRLSCSADWAFPNSMSENPSQSGFRSPITRRRSSCRFLAYLKAPRRSRRRFARIASVGMASEGDFTTLEQVLWCASEHLFFIIRTLKIVCPVVLMPVSLSFARIEIPRSPF